MGWNIPRKTGRVTRLDTYIHIDGLALSYRCYRIIVSNESTGPDEQPQGISKVEAI
jgi:hypothetical protein